MATYSKKVRKPVRSVLISLLAKVDDPSVQIISGESEMTAGYIERPDEDGIYWETRLNGRTHVHIDLDLYDPRKDETLCFDRPKKGS